MIKKYEYDLCDRKMEVTIGEVAEQANEACLIQSGETVFLATVVGSKEPREGINFFPLTCNFEEKLYSVGKIPGRFIKREGRPGEKATLTARLIGRPLGPLFLGGCHNDVQVIATVLSVNQDNTPDILAMIGSSIALDISDIPFLGPTGSVAVGIIGDEFTTNPTKEQREKSNLELTVSGTKDAIVMVEAGCNNITEQRVSRVILRAHEEIKRICEFIESIRKECGKPRQELIQLERDIELDEEVKSFCIKDLKKITVNEDKLDREDHISALERSVIDYFVKKYDESITSEVSTMYDDLEESEVRRLMLENHIRPDNRELGQIREATCDVDILSRPHGSGLLKRDQAQVLSATALGTPSDTQVLNGLIEQEGKRYMYQYNFPPYPVGDVRPLRSPGRREIDHGVLAEGTLLPVIPLEEEFPYTIGVASEILSSNGSNSQASVCGSTLSLLDADVLIKEPVAGIAMGLIKEDDDVVILSNIQGLRGHLGDMDFKIAGTKDGVTALQMDTRITGISEEILTGAPERARVDRLHILSLMNECISELNKGISKYAPRVMVVNVASERVREVIGPGGKVISKIIDGTGVKIDTGNGGRITVAGENTENAQRAIDIIREIVREPETGERYLGRVTKIMNFDAFVEILPGKEGLLHISNIAHEGTNRVEDVSKESDEIMVKLMDIDDQDRMTLSRKTLLLKPERKEKENFDKKSEDQNSEDK